MWAFDHIVGATPLVDSAPSNLLIRWPILLIRWPTLLFRDPLCWFGFPLCWCGSTKFENRESENGHRPECWFGSVQNQHSGQCLNIESTKWVISTICTVLESIKFVMSKTRIYKSGHTYNLHGCQQSPRFINRINKLCQRIAQNVDTGLV